MSRSDNGKEFLFSDDCGFVNRDDGDVNHWSDGSADYHGNDGSEGHIYSDGSGYFHGADGSDGYIYSDGSAYFHGADGSDGYKYSDGSGYYHGADGSDGYKYSDGSGYFNSSDGNYSSFDSSECEDESTDDQDTDSAASAIGEALGEFLFYAIEAKKQQRRAERERLAKEEEARQKAEQEMARIRAAKRRQRLKSHWKGLLLLSIFAMFALIIAVGAFEYSKLIPVGYSSAELIGVDHQDVAARLKDAGFSLINEKPVADLTIANIAEENLVSSIKIGWTSDFQSITKFPSNFLVTISYHTLKEVYTPISSKDAKGMNYKAVISTFSDAGFSNITAIPEYDIVTGWISNDGEVKSVEIGTVGKFSTNEAFRPDVDIEITYHTFKKNAPKK